MLIWLLFKLFTTFTAASIYVFISSIFLNEEPVGNLILVCTITQYTTIIGLIELIFVPLALETIMNYEDNN